MNDHVIWNRAQLLKLTMLLDNLSLKLWLLNICIYANIFAEKMWVAFAVAKAYFAVA